MVKRGRPVSSMIRQHIVEILYFMGSGYGYQIFEVYRRVYAPVTLRSIYYHLHKGLVTKEFKVEKVKIEKGQFSWGGEVEKTYYSLGDSAKPQIDSSVKEYFDSKRGDKH